MSGSALGLRWRGIDGGCIVTESGAASSCIRLNRSAGACLTSSDSASWPSPATPRLLNAIVRGMESLIISGSHDTALRLWSILGFIHAP